MEMALLGVSPEAWFPIITLLVGALLKGVFDILTERRAERREARLRREQRRDALQLKRAEFQHATLVEFQEATGRLVRLFGRAHFVDEMHFRETGKWKGARLPSDLDQDLANEQAIFARLRVRIRDEKTRKLAADFSDLAIGAIMSKDQDDARAAMMAMTDRMVELTERVGELIRDLESDEDALVLKDAR
ncbi:hypothetical protein O3S81_20260 [Agrobacterium sp. SOY23]|uniref:hypothetical protein n=1 Tax=Agrobacterium sp. SOY23 TaxID=3014555 RepID=UPI0022B06B97|nr:hypothetical protein [Agrobacterium sp. SOY23]MCZ4432047.1 hypothetical protein [Agrobacterium sp. SOY23]